MLRRVLDGVLRCGGAGAGCSRVVLSWPGAMMGSANMMMVQLRLDLGECPAPAHVSFAS